MKFVAVLGGYFLLIAASHADQVQVCEGNRDCVLLQSLSFIVSHLRATNITHAGVRICESAILSEPLVFSNLSSSLESVRLHSHENHTVSITCNGSIDSEMGAGLFFRQVYNISIAFLTFKGCYIRHRLLQAGVSTLTYSSGLFFMNCMDISLQKVTVKESHGSGATLLGNTGIINITESYFIGNKVPELYSSQLHGGNGLFLLMHNVNDTTVVIHDCHFVGNNASSTFFDFSNISSQNDIIRVDSGGGLSMTIMGSSTGNTISITDCVFRKNEASWGGGMNIRFHGEPLNNLVTISTTSIEDNCCYSNDGGGLDIGIVLLNEDGMDISGNFISLEYCNFTRNYGKLYGGGTSIYSTRLMNSDPETHFITFTGCVWEGNTALAGSAVDVSPSVDQLYINGVFPRPLFINCSFKSNCIKSQKTYLGYGVNRSTAGVGTILNTGFIIQFSGTTVISDNVGTGLYLSSGTAEFLEGSSTLFQSNTGEKGGAVYVSTFALLLVHDNSHLRFTNNRASAKGGAVFVFSSDPHESLNSRTCFIQYSGRSPARSGTTFTFENNTAFDVNSSNAFIQSVEPCSCLLHRGSAMETFLCIGSVNAESGLNISTSVEKFKLRPKPGSILSEIVPGNINFSVPVDSYDAYNNSRQVVYEVFLTDPSPPIRPQFTHIARNRMQFVGSLNETVKMKLETENSVLTFSIRSSKSCSPGYVWDARSEMCVCGAERIFGIAFCNRKGAYITQGFWIGHCSDGQVCTSHCPLGFCVYDGSTVNENVHLLPNDSSALQQFICGFERNGTLCGTCSESHSVFYHSYRYACHMNKNCKYGILLYIVSELFPLTIMFVFIIVMEIKFTSGHINGFILFAQVLDSISIDANGVINFPFTLQIVTAIHRSVYRTLNFDFFSLESLSFCIWSRATALDAMALKYVTVLYAVVLLVLLIIFMNTLRCRRILSCWKPSTIQGSAINGVTAFIVICYSQCARVSFQILSPAYPYGVNYTRQSPVAFRRGEYGMFSPPHLQYAIPALAVLLIMSLIPLLLILYPLIFKVLALCKLSESKLAKAITRLFPIPLLDVFQSSFKDNCRFFAGLYFLYRLFALAAYAYSSTLVIFYTVVELQLILILALHAVVQPYKERWHNVIDSLIFANLAVINGFTLFNYFKVINGNRKDGLLENSVTAVISLQAILVYLPLVILLVCLFAFCFKKLKSRFTMDLPSDESLISSVELPPLRTEEAESRKRKSSINSDNRTEPLLLYTYGN